jgi:integrase
MVTKHLTQKAVDALKTEHKQEDVWDSGFRLRGITLGVRVTRHGAKEYICRYRDSTGRRKRRTLGDARKISLRDAHEKARDVADGMDGEITSANNGQFSEDSPITFGALCEEYLRRHASQKKDSGKRDAQAIRRDLLPAWGEMQASDVRRRDVIALLDSIALDRHAPVMANRTRALISKIFSFGVEREMVDNSPCTGLPRKRREKPKDRFLQDQEIRTLWRMLEEEPPFVAAMLRMIVLTGQRPGEVVAARWEEFDNGIWTIPKERVKNGRTHRLPLSPQVQALLEWLRYHPKQSAIGTQCQYVFPSTRNGFLSSRAIQQAIRRVNRKGGLRHFTAHDLRRTCATGLRRIGVTRETVSRILNHTPRTVTLVYDWYDEMPEMRHALEAWGEWVARIAAPPTSHDQPSTYLMLAQRAVSGTLDASSFEDSRARSYQALRELPDNQEVYGIRRQAQGAASLSPRGEGTGGRIRNDALAVAARGPVPYATSAQQEQGCLACERSHGVDEDTADSEMIATIVGYSYEP